VFRLTFLEFPILSSSGVRRPGVSFDQLLEGSGALQDEALPNEKAAMIIPTITLFHSPSTLKNPSANGDMTSHTPASTLIRLHPVWLGALS
jgi:hypothetical protein